MCWCCFLLILALSSIKIKSDEVLLKDIFKIAVNLRHVARLHVKHRSYTHHCLGVYVAPYFILTSHSCLKSPNPAASQLATHSHSQAPARGHSQDEAHARADDRIVEVIVCTGHGRISEHSCEQRMRGVNIVRHRACNLALVETFYDFDARYLPMLQFVDDVETIRAMHTSTRPMPCYGVGFEQRDAFPAPSEIKITATEFLGECVDDHTVCILANRTLRTRGESVPVCQADSGGPLLCGGKLIGILRKATDCSHHSELGAIDEYTKVVPLRRFLRQSESILEHIINAGLAIKAGRTLVAAHLFVVGLLNRLYDYFVAARAHVWLPNITPPI